MKSVSRVLCSIAVMSAFPMIAGAAGTYYNGNLYQNPQQTAQSRYPSGEGGFYNNYGAGRGYGQNMQGMQNMGTRKGTARTTNTATKKTTATNKNKHGLVLGAGVTHEFADWGFNMKTAGSYLHYDNLRWNVFDIDGAYYFGDSVPVQINVGAKYGMQFGDSPMIDDDVTHGAYSYAEMPEGYRYGHAMSLGTSRDGNQMGFNAAFGLADLISMGRVKVTPSVGYRYFKYELQDKNNYGIAMDTFEGNSSYSGVSCIDNGNGEIQCDPSVMFYFYDIDGVYLGYAVGGRPDVDTDIVSDVNMLPSGTKYVTVDLGNTYYYEQSGTSHKYETTWMGPYLALDMEYMINDDNNVVAGVEFGLPVYDSKGDQPYRFDWEHPTSVEDKGEFGDAYHLGFNAAWKTRVSDNVGFTLGLTYDYYKVSGATATTYYNRKYYTGIVDALEDYIEYLEDNGAAPSLIAAYQDSLADAEAVVNSFESIGWKSENKDEIESIYKSMGIRLGIEVKF